MEESEFNVGDWIIAVNAISTEVFKYTHLTREGNYGLNNKSNLYYDKKVKLRKAFPHEIPNYELKYEVW